MLGNLFRSATAASASPPAPAEVTQAQASIATVPEYHLRETGPLSPSWLRETVCTYDASQVDLQNVISATVFHEISKYPKSARSLLAPYFTATYGGHPLYRQIVAAHHHGSGRHHDALIALDAILNTHQTPFHAVMAAQCLMRPAGRENQALKYLNKQCARFPDDPLLRIHLATALFCCNETLAANIEMAKAEPALRVMLKNYDANLAELQTELDTALHRKIVYRKFRYDEMSYREDLIPEHWEPYYYWMTAQSKHLMFGWLSSFFIGKLTDLGRQTDEVYNFGAMCAQPDHEAALALPGTKFVGVDRQNTTAELNRKAFPTSNISFEAAEIEDVIRRLPKGPRRSLFHARTATLCYPEKIRQLYRLCAASGFQHIGLFENVALSHNSYRFNDLGGDLGAPSVIYKNDQFIHDYKSMLKDAGYKLVREERMFSPLITPFSEIDLASAHIYLEAQLA